MAFKKAGFTRLIFIISPWVKNFLVEAPATVGRRSWCPTSKDITHYVHVPDTVMHILQQS
jgi:hypothetical protein